MTIKLTLCTSALHHRSVYAFSETVPNHVKYTLISLPENLETLWFILFPFSFLILQEYRRRLWFATDTKWPTFSFRFSHTTFMEALEKIKEQKVLQSYLAIGENSYNSFIHECSSPEI